MEQLIAFVREASRIEDPEALAGRALSVGMEIFPSELGEIYLRHPGGRPLELRQTEGRSSFTTAEAEAFQEMIKNVLRKGRPVFLESEIEGGLEALGLPLRHGHEVIGAMVVGGYGPVGDSLSAQDDAEVLSEQLGAVLVKLTGGGTGARPRLLEHDAFEMSAAEALARCAADGRHAALILVRLEGVDGLDGLVAPLVATFRPTDLVGRRDDRTLEVLALSYEPRAAVSVAERIQRLMPASRVRPMIGAALYPEHADYFEALENGALEALKRAAACAEPCLCLMDEAPRPLSLVDPVLDAMLLSHPGRQALVMAVQLMDHGGGAATVREMLRLALRATQADAGMIATASRTLAASGIGGEAETAVARAFVGRVLETDRPLFERDAMGRGTLALSKDVEVEGIQSVLCLPVRRRGRVLSALYLIRRAGGRSFGDTDFRLVELFLERVGGLLGRTPAGKAEGRYGEALAGFERDYFTGAMEAAGGSISAAARATGLSRNGLKAKLRRLGVRF